MQPSTWLTWAHVILPFSFFVIGLTNRRFGLGYALALIAVTWTLIGLAVAGSLQFGVPATGIELPAMRTCIAFVAAAILGQAIGATFFDRTRGVVWWHAPFFGALAGAIFYVLIFYVGAFAGTGAPWLSRMVVDFGLNAVLAILLLLPYAILRPILRPMPGFGGY